MEAFKGVSLPQHRRTPRRRAADFAPIRSGTVPTKPLAPARLCADLWSAGNTYGTNAAPGVRSGKREVGPWPAAGGLAPFCRAPERTSAAEVGPLQERLFSIWQGPDYGIDCGTGGRSDEFQYR